MILVAVLAGNEQIKVFLLCSPQTRVYCPLGGIVAHGLWWDLGRKEDLRSVDAGAGDGAAACLFVAVHDCRVDLRWLDIRVLVRGGWRT